MIVTLPIPGFVSVVGLAVLGLPGYRIPFAPGLPSDLVDLALFFLGKFLIGNEFFHNATFSWFLPELYPASRSDS